MKYLAFITLLFLPVSAPIETGEIQVYFSPGGGCVEAIVNQIDKAKTSIFVQAYSFTSAPIAKALIDAKDRGVKVLVILDRRDSHGMYSEKDFLSHAGIGTYLDGKHPISHSKSIMIDDSIVLTGSYNFSKQAESNSENLLVINSQKIAAQYIQNWSNHFNHSEEYK